MCKVSHVSTQLFSQHLYLTHHPRAGMFMLYSDLNIAITIPFLFFLRLLLFLLFDMRIQQNLTQCAPVPMVNLFDLHMPRLVVSMSVMLFTAMILLVNFQKIDTIIGGSVDFNVGFNEVNHDWTK